MGYLTNMQLVQMQAIISRTLAEVNYFSYLRKIVYITINNNKKTKQNYVKSKALTKVKLELYCIYIDFQKY